ncbi:hypothetical protein ACFLQR_02170, partial [Verrucomicrobiota bacterium]
QIVGNHAAADNTRVDRIHISFSELGLYDLSTDPPFEQRTTLRSVQVVTIIIEVRQRTIIDFQL